jgi:hypothetical protein
MPLSTWARTESWRTPRAADDSEPRERDELRDLIAGLALPPQVAGVEYARGCRIRRVRVPGGKGPRGGQQTVILSRRALDEARASYR